MKFIKNLFIGLGYMLGGILVICFAVTLVNVLGQFIFRYIPFIADVQNKGSLGDAMNGLSAPIITMGSAILIYYTFREQNKANKILSDQVQFDSYFKLFSEMEQGINTLHLNYLEEYREGLKKQTDFYGVEGLSYFVEHHNHFETKDKLLYLNKLSLILEDIILLVNTLIKNKPENQLYFIRRINKFYTANIADSFNIILQDLTPMPEFIMFKECSNRMLKAIARMRHVDHSAAAFEIEANIKEVEALKTKLSPKWKELYNRMNENDIKKKSK